MNVESKSIQKPDIVKLEKGCFKIDPLENRPFQLFLRLLCYNSTVLTGGFKGFRVFQENLTIIQFGRGRRLTESCRPAFKQSSGTERFAVKR